MPTPRPSREPLTRRVLIVCTANLCRSPTAQRLLQRRLDDIDLDASSWAVSSAGVADVWAPPDANTQAAAAAVGIDLRGHAPRHLDADVLRADGADLVLTMTREHLRAVVAVDQRWWPRTFTLKEIVRRAQQVPEATPAEGLGGWLERLAEGRRAAELIRPDPLDDLPDPYGAPRRFHDEMVADLSHLVDELVRLGPWRERGTGD